MRQNEYLWSKRLKKKANSEVGKINVLRNNTNITELCCLQPTAWARLFSLKKKKETGKQKLESNFSLSLKEMGVK